ncbi:MAG: MarR family transcriptional regulator [Alphaproteobacteria bacterium]|uniref:MarR family winged helix-turn-helix transcriptional regulator n=1 Tax=Brevundimonas sp. TaxID=1871086 RepID=UPI0017958DEF|nr:MarR family transcriptional regulator [Brevundimonas sp.]MBA3050892.1 MarR family transcriptional regulator [Brevundimonas sp.]MBU3974673.1 MarR family transcriptional regulator [Alphaproteobacteria bacterium]MBU4040792.1 MarR family transcriptional regulator [Alphaproteobacteria bacterium]MBU4137793.1 MarR family transcriptional regulator [Alphaproteobacteria bacterium]
MTEAHETADRLTLASVRLTRWLRAADPSPTLSGPQASALAVVVHSGRIRMSDLAVFEEVSRPTITRVAGELQALGLIDRAADPADGRIGWLSATAAGRARLADGQARRIAPLAAAVSALPDDRRAALAEGLAVLESLLTQAVPPPTAAVQSGIKYFP